MKNAFRIRPRIALFCFALLPLFAAAQAIPDKKAVVADARKAYYNLPNESVASFQCSMTPNWNQILDDVRKQDPAAADNALKMLNQLHFVVSVGSDSKVNFTHNDLPAENKQMTDALAQIYSGMQQMTSGFFDVWNVFMINRPFPEVAGEYQLEDLGREYRLTYDEDKGATHVVTSLGKDFAISGMKITTAQFHSSIQPTFNKSPKGWVLSGFDSHYETGKPEEAVQLKILIGYQETDGIQMLRKMTLSGSYGPAAVTLEVAFSDCQVTKKPADH